MYYVNILLRINTEGYSVMQTTQCEMERAAFDSQGLSTGDLGASLKAEDVDLYWQDLADVEIDSFFQHCKKMNTHQKQDVGLLLAKHIKNKQLDRYSHFMKRYIEFVSSELDATIQSAVLDRFNKNLQKNPQLTLTNDVQVVLFQWASKEKDPHVSQGIHSILSSSHANKKENNCLQLLGTRCIQQ